MSVLPPLLLLMGLEENLGGERKLCPNYQLLGAKHTAGGFLSSPVVRPLTLCRSLPWLYRHPQGCALKTNPAKKERSSKGQGAANLSTAAGKRAAWNDVWEFCFPILLFSWTEKKQSCCKQQSSSKCSTEFYNPPL